MSDTKSLFPKGDLLHSYESDDSPKKFEYLQGKYVFRFPFTLTAIKWGFALGSFFGLHTYFRTKNLWNSVYWFTCGTILTGMPIWGFYMMKYTFYSLTLRKFEKEQFEQIEDYNIARDYIKKKINIEEENITDGELMNLINLKQREKYLQYSQLDEYLSENEMEKIESIIEPEIKN